MMCSNPEFGASHGRCLLALRKDATLAEESFLNHLYGGMDEPKAKIVDVFICKLRRRLSNASAARITSKRCGDAAIHCARPLTVSTNPPGARRIAQYPRDQKLLTSWTLSPDHTTMISNPEFGASHGRCGLAAAPGPRKV